jgi:predicted NBD/HSP70 family sugar kinase
MAALEKEITLDDRTRGVALAHHLLWSENRCHRSAIYVQVGTGIGAGIFVDGRMLRGASLSSGEIGHMVIDRAGPVCACGKRGCVEAFASLGATLAYVTGELERGAKSSLRKVAAEGGQITAEMIVAAARQSDALAIAALRRAAEALGTAIANAVHLLNPSLVVLVGKFANVARDLLLDIVAAVIERECFDTMSRCLEIRIAPHRKDAAAVGCALLAALDVAEQRVQETLFRAADKLAH